MSAVVRTLSLPDEAATLRLGALLASLLRPLPGAVLFLVGDLGAGKTTLARGLLQALGVRGRVRSPTYTLLEPYEVDGRTVLHLDLYRLRDPGELQNLGLEDYPPERCLWLLEWPDKGGSLLPVPTVVVHLTLRGSGREARIELSLAAPRPLAAELNELLKVEYQE
jgi:tRNA threonylcarbamoyladenosine biosynthesis protein TsaE